MRETPKLLLLIFFIAIVAPVHGQTLSFEDGIMDTVLLQKPVHFRDIEGQDIVVPAGAYWVTPGEETLELLRLEDGENFTISAVAGEHSEEMAQPIAVSTSGTEEQADVHSVAYLHSDGSLLIAEGTYSGIQARGFLSDAVRRKAAAARAAVQRAAARAKQRVRERIAQARRIKEQVAAKIRMAARADLGRMLQEIATTEAREGRVKAGFKAARYAPRMAVAMTASLSAQQKVKLIQAAHRELQNRMPFIREVYKRALTVKSLLLRGSENLSRAENQSVRDAIFGRGDNALQHPFAGRTVTARGVGDGIRPSWSVGVSGDAGLGIGVSIGVSQAFPFNPRYLGTCTYVGASIDLGLQEEVEANASVGFYLGGHETLGASSVENWLGGFEVAVNIGATVVGGAEIVLLFSIPSEDLAYIPLTGIQIGISGGEGAEVAVGVGYGLQLGCI